METRKRLWIILWIILLISSDQLLSQEIKSVDKWMEYLDELAADGEDTERLESLYADLSYLVEHPIDLNLATEEDWRRLPFLSDRQIEELMDYRTRNGDWLSVYELKNLLSLDFATIELLKPFVTVEKREEKVDFSLKNLLKYGKNELVIRYDQTFQQKKGYRQVPAAELEEYPNRKYLGEPFSHSLRYAYGYEDRLQLGLVAEKDAGEPFWTPVHKGYDYYSFHFFLKDIGWLKSLALGDYRLSFGQGLVVSHDFTPGKGAILTQAERRRNGFRRHYSTNEQDFFRGAAATIGIKDWQLNLFYSRKRVDGNLEGHRFTSLKTDGQHRLKRDWEKRGVIPSQSYGGHLRFQREKYSIGLTFLGYDFGGYDFQPSDQPYNRYYFRGRWNVNGSVDYRWKNDNFLFYGETAFSKKGGFATLNALRYSPVSYFSVLALHRYYDKRYQALYANAFAQGSQARNEHGVYFGLEWTPFAFWKLSGYADLFRFPWLKFGVDYPSKGEEYMVRLDYSPEERWAVYLRYKYSRKEKNFSGENEEGLLSYRRQRLRAQFSWVFNDWVLKTGADGNLYGENNRGWQRGFLVSQAVGWRPSSMPLQVDFFGGFFSTDDYDTRVYASERNLLFTYYSSFFYGKGFRFSGAIRWEFPWGLMLSAKIGHAFYLNRDRLGSDLEEILGRHKTDGSLLVRWKF